MVQLIAYVMKTSHCFLVRCIDWLIDWLVWSLIDPWNDWLINWLAYWWLIDLLIYTEGGILWFFIWLFLLIDSIILLFFLSRQILFVNFPARTRPRSLPKCSRLRWNSADCCIVLVRWSWKPPKATTVSTTRTSVVACVPSSWSTISWRTCAGSCSTPAPTAGSISTLFGRSLRAPKCWEDKVISSNANQSPTPNDLNALHFKFIFHLFQLKLN